MSSVTSQRSDNGPQPRLVIPAHDGVIWRLAYLPDGRRVVTGSKDGTVKVWNLESREQEGTSMEHESEIKGFAVTRDGTKVISGDEDGNIKVWNIESHELVKEWTHPESSPEIAISLDDRLIAVGAWRVGVYTMEGRQVNRSIEVGKAVWSMCFSPNGNKLACGTRDDIHVYDIDNSTLVLGPLRGHEKRVSCMLWSRDGGTLSSGSYDKTIRCWNSDTGEQIGRPWTGHTDHIRSLSLSPDGSILTSASVDHTVRFWDATTGNPVGQQLQHDTLVHAVRFSPFGESVASAGWDGNIYLWRAPSFSQHSSVSVHTGEQVGHFDHFSGASIVLCLLTLCNSYLRLVPSYYPCCPRPTRPRWNPSDSAEYPTSIPFP
jgi:WD40 repeat protein